MATRKAKGKTGGARQAASANAAPAGIFTGGTGVALAVAAIVGITIAVYAGVSSFDFIQFDDPGYIVHNPHIADGLTWSAVKWAFTTGYLANWHPLTWLSHMTDVALFGIEPGPSHVVNLALHVANALLLFGVLRSMTGATGRSVCVALLFAVHPLHVESVAWVSERKDVLSSLFWMLTLWAYVRYVRRTGQSAAGPSRRQSVALAYGAVLVLFALGLMAKPMLVTLPFVLLLADIWPLARFPNTTRGVVSERVWRPIVEKLPLFALAALSAVATFFAQRAGGAVITLQNIPAPLRIENALVTYLQYIAKMCWPARLLVYYPHPKAFPVWQVTLSAALLVAISVLVVVARRRRPYLAVGWFWYLGTLVPVIGLVQVGRQAMADRYTYVPLVGLFILVVWGLGDLLARWRVNRWVPALGASAVILSLAVTAHAQVQYWRNDSALWTHALEDRFDRLGLRDLMDDRRTHEFLDDLLAEPVLMPLLGLLETTDPSTAQHFIGLVLARHNHLDDAVALYSAAIALKPDAADMHAELGEALSRQGKEDAAIAEYSAALRLNATAAPGLTAEKLAELHTDFGVSLAREGRAGEALPHFEEAVRLQPDRADTHRNLGLALAGAGRLGDAIAEFREALRLKPTDETARQALETLMKRGK